MKVKRTQLGLVVFLALLSLSGCSLDTIAAQQVKATDLWDELVAGDTFGQSFVSTRDNLYRIDLGTATYARINSAPVIFHLRTGAEASTDIVSITLPGPEIQNERPTSVQFQPLANSRDKQYYFYIESPEARPGNAITVYANAFDQYADGAAYRKGQVVAGDLVFQAYALQTFTFAEVSKDFYSRASQDKPFFIFYGALILVLVAALIAVTVWRAGPTMKAGDD